MRASRITNVAFGEVASRNGVSILAFFPNPGMDDNTALFPPSAPYACGIEIEQRRYPRTPSAKASTDPSSGGSTQVHSWPVTRDQPARDWGRG